MSGSPALSIVVPVYDEEDNVAPLFAELTRVATDLGKPYEIIFVNDGSRDATLARLEALRAADRHLRIQRRVRAQRHGVFRVRRVV